MRPAIRFIRHVMLAALVIIASICITEVGLRTNRLRNEFSGLIPIESPTLATPCPIAFQRLPISQKISHWSSPIGTALEISTNLLGLRGGEIVIPKPKGSFRIICLGDDATLAPDMLESETFCGSLPQVLASLGSQVEVINAGQPGHCPLLNLAWARSHLIGLQPDLVVLCCDVSDVGDDRRCRPLARFNDKGQVLSVTHPAVSSEGGDLVSAIEREFIIAKLFSEHFEEQIATSSFDQSGTASMEPFVDDAAGHPTVLIEQAWEPLAGLRDLCREISAEFVVAVVPSQRTVDAVATAGDNASMSPGTSEVLRLLSERASLEQIPLLDASPEFAASENPTRLFFRSTGAMSAEGHQLFARILGNALLERQSAINSPVAVPVGAQIPNDSPLNQPTAPLPTLDRRRRPRAESSFAETIKE